MKPVSISPPSPKTPCVIARRISFISPRRSPNVDIDFLEALVDLLEALVDFFEAPIDQCETFVDELEAEIDFFVQRVEPVVAPTLPHRLHDDGGGRNLLSVVELGLEKRHDFHTEVRQ
jgi:hypothetical protein